MVIGLVNLVSLKLALHKSGSFGRRKELIISHCNLIQLSTSATYILPLISYMGHTAIKQDRVNI